MEKRKINQCSNIFGLAKSLIANLILIFNQGFSQILGRLLHETFL